MTSHHAMPNLPLHKWIDIPPVWLACFAAVAWGLAGLGPVQLSAAFPWTPGLGALLVGTGLGLIGAAALAFQRHKTSIVPHLTPDTLIRTGPFAWSRNPIYLADALILLGLILRWDAVLALPLVPIFMWIIQNRFILAEEARLAAEFGEKFHGYARNVRRWL